MKKYWRHFKTITMHKWYVMKACFRVGLYWQGLVHDLSKYSITEFFASAKYFQGDKSPIDAEKTIKGYSIAWQNHKGKNRHHWQYWTDFENGKLRVLEMPPEYLMEMLCDWIGAGKAYNRNKWTIESFKTWYENNKDMMILHEATRYVIEYLIENARCEEDLYRLINRDFIMATLEFLYTNGGGFQRDYNIV